MKKLESIEMNDHASFGPDGGGRSPAQDENMADAEGKGRADERILSAIAKIE